MARRKKTENGAGENGVSDKSENANPGNDTEDPLEALNDSPDTDAEITTPGVRVEEDAVEGMGDPTLEYGVISELAPSTDTEPTLLDSGATVTDIHAGEEPAPDAVEPGRLEAIVESLLFASDRPLTLAELKRLVGERDGKRITTAVEALAVRREGSGVRVTSAAGGWQLRTSPENAPWVSKLLAARPIRLSRAMMETLAIVAYRQPVTRPEIDEIRGVDCGPVLKTLLDRTLIRIIGKKEEVGRPLLYGTTPEFLRTFNLRDLSELPTLREFHELGAEERAEVDATLGVPSGESREAAPLMPAEPLSPDPEENDRLLDELEHAAQAAARAGAAAEPPKPKPTEESSPGPDPGSSSEHN